MQDQLKKERSCVVRSVHGYADTASLSVPVEPVQRKNPWSKDSACEVQKTNSLLLSLPNVLHHAGFVDRYPPPHQYHQPQPAGSLTESGFCSFEEAESPALDQSLPPDAGRIPQKTILP